MKKYIFLFTLIVGLLSINTRGFGQISVSYDYSSTNRIGLGYNFSKTFWTEVRVYGNSSFDDLKAELALLFNVIKQDKYILYIGVSGLPNNGLYLTVPIGIQFRPIESFKRFSIQIEIQPGMNLQSDVSLFQSSAGIRYTFGD